MAHINTAVRLVVKHIIQNGLYSFKSLTEDTQEKLINAYGADFEEKVNANLVLD